MFKSRNNKELELGFGTKTYKKNVRLLNKDGSVNIRRKGNSSLNSIDIYHWFITTSWLNLIVIILLAYLVTNTIFASIYFLIGYENFGGIVGFDGPERFLDLFFFSAQTLTTVGYGHVYPNATNVSSIAAIESMLGLLGFAIATGILYGRFSRPKAVLLYSSKVLISPYQGGEALMFRVANTKQNELIEVEASVVLSFTNPDTLKREFTSLELERKKINFLTLSWTIVHPIDEKSPFKLIGMEVLKMCDPELIILIKAINDTYSQSVYSRMSYKEEDFVEKVKFVPLKQESNKSGLIQVSLSEIHNYEPISS